MALLISLSMLSSTITILVNLTGIIARGYKTFMLKNTHLALLVLLAINFILPCGSQAAIYRYVDGSGRIHFTNVPQNNKFRFYRSEGEKYHLDTLINHYADKFNLNRSLLKAVIRVESNFDPQVVSSKGAQGLMQLMPETAREVGVSNPFNPSDSIYGGSRYLRKMLDSFDLNLDYALAAYNAGPGAVRKYGGIPPFEETQKYVKLVKHYYNYYSVNK